MVASVGQRFAQLAFGQQVNAIYCNNYARVEMLTKGAGCCGAEKCLENQLDRFCFGAFVVPALCTTRRVELHCTVM